MSNTVWINISKNNRLVLNMYGKIYIADAVNMLEDWLSCDWIGFRDPENNWCVKYSLQRYRTKKGDIVFMLYEHYLNNEEKPIDEYTGYEINYLKIGTGKVEGFKKLINIKAKGYPIYIF